MGLLAAGIGDMFVLPRRCATRATLSVISTRDHLNSGISTSLFPKAGNFGGGAEVRPPGKGGTPLSRGSPGDRHGEERQAKVPGINWDYYRQGPLPTADEPRPANHEGNPSRSGCSASFDLRGP